MPITLNTHVQFLLSRIHWKLQLKQARRVILSISFLSFGFYSCEQVNDSQKSKKLILNDELLDSLDIDETDNSTYTISDLENKIESAGLVDVQNIEPTLLVDLRYSTSNNFLKTDLYGDLEKCYLQTDVAEKLQLAQLLLKTKYPSYSLLVFDGVRPRAVQWKMWKILDMPAREKTKYVSNPNNGSLHNFGAAVDLTIADERGEPIDMGTEFDFFGELAYPRLEDKMIKEGKLSKKQLDNRLLLREAMTNAGFTALTTEWWHFNSCTRHEARQKYEIIE